VLVQNDIPTVLPSNNDQTVLAPKIYSICSKDSNAMKSANPHSGIYEAETSRTIDANGGNPSCNQGGIAIVESVAFTQNQRDEVRDLNGKSGAITAEQGVHQHTYVLQGSVIGRDERTARRATAET
jgi:DNA (cytosine-5)-methyltransferase 1